MTKHRCDLSGCKKEPTMRLIYYQKDNQQVKSGWLCKYHYSEAWDLEGLGCVVFVINTETGKPMKKIPRYCLTIKEKMECYGIG